MITKTKRRSYWKSREVSNKLMELYARAFRFNPHGYEIYCNRFNSKCCLVLTVNLFYTKDSNAQKVVQWHTREYDSLEDLFLSNIWLDI